MQRLDAPVEDLGEAGHVGDLRHRKTGLREVLPGAARGDELEAVANEGAGQVEEAGAVGDGEEGALRAHRTGYGPFDSGRATAIGASPPAVFQIQARSRAERVSPESYASRGRAGRERRGDERLGGVERARREAPEARAARARARSARLVRGRAGRREEERGLGHEPSRLEGDVGERAVVADDLRDPARPGRERRLPGGGIACGRGGEAGFHPLHEPPRVLRQHPLEVGRRGRRGVGRHQADGRDGPARTLPPRRFPRRGGAERGGRRAGPSSRADSTVRPQKLFRKTR